LIDPLLQIGPRVTALPVVHGSGDFAWEVRRLMASHDFDCLAVPLPASFQVPVERAILHLPVPSVVIQRDHRDPQNGSTWDADFPIDERRIEGDFDDEWGDGTVSYVPIDPCQPVIAAIRTAMGERLPCHFVDLETSLYRPHTQVLPDAYALKKVSIAKWAAAVLPSLVASPDEQWRNRVQAMAWNLRQLSVDYRKILFVTSVLDWPWVRAAFLDRELAAPVHEPVSEATNFRVHQPSLYFLLGELPLITQLYETARRELGDDANLSIDGVKELLIMARESYQADFKSRARKITPKLLAQITKYTRNLTLIDYRFTPQLSTIVTAAQQIAGDGYALHVLETAKQYEQFYELIFPQCRMSIERIGFDDGEICPASNRLPGPPQVWSQLQLIPKPDTKQQQDWQQRWNPYSQCSWPPEDELIENFRQTVFDRALEVMGADLAQTEKFTTSIKDGIDIRETVRHWYDGEIRVKVLPPTQGKLDTAVMLFDSPADPRDYPWRTTWYAEHKDESTLAFYATNFADQPVGPGICLASYGGALFIYPPIAIPDIWNDHRLDFCETLEERLLAAACVHSQCPHIALVSNAPPGPAWRMLARKFKKTWVHLPLSRFSDSTIQQLRMVHVLNGQEVRSVAAEFIRRV